MNNKTTKHIDTSFGLRFLTALCILFTPFTVDAADCYALSSQSSGPCDSSVNPLAKNCPVRSPEKDCGELIEECRALPDDVKTEIIVMHGIRSCVYTGDENDCCETEQIAFCVYEQDYVCVNSSATVECWMEWEAGVGWQVVSAGASGGTKVTGPQGCLTVDTGFPRQNGTYSLAQNCN